MPSVVNVHESSRKNMKPVHDGSHTSRSRPLMRVHLHEGRTYMRVWHQKGPYHLPAAIIGGGVVPRLFKTYYGVRHSYGGRGGQRASVDEVDVDGMRLPL